MLGNSTGTSNEARAVALRAGLSGGQATRRWSQYLDASFLIHPGSYTSSFVAASPRPVYSDIASEASKRSRDSRSLATYSATVSHGKRMRDSSMMLTGMSMSGMCGIISSTSFDQCSMRPNGVESSLSSLTLPLRTRMTKG